MMAVMRPRRTWTSRLEKIGRPPMASCTPRTSTTTSAGEAADARCGGSRLVTRSRRPPRGSGGLALHLGPVAPGGRQAVEPRALGEFLLSGGEIRSLPGPPLERVLLQRPAVTEGQR